MPKYLLFSSIDEKGKEDIEYLIIRFHSFFAEGHRDAYQEFIGEQREI
jgi:hypothetical protein